MAKVTIIFGVLLIVLGLAGYFGTGSARPTALIPAWFGVALGVGGFLAISPSEGRRKIFMHINVTIGLIGCVGAFIVGVQGYGHARSLGEDPDYIAFAAKIAMGMILLTYTILCVRSFIEARRARQE